MYGCEVIPTWIVCVDGTEVEKVREVTEQPAITSKLKVFCATVAEKFAEFTVRTNECGPRSIGLTRRLRFTSIVALKPPIDMYAGKELKLAVIGHTIVG